LHPFLTTYFIFEHFPPLFIYFCALSTTFYLFLHPFTLLFAPFPTTFCLYPFLPHWFFFVSLFLTFVFNLSLYFFLILHPLLPLSFHFLPLFYNVLFLNLFLPRFVLNLFLPLFCSYFFSPTFIFPLFPNCPISVTSIQV